MPEAGVPAPGRDFTVHWIGPESVSPFTEAMTGEFVVLVSLPCGLRCIVTSDRRFWNTTGTVPWKPGTVPWKPATANTVLSKNILSYRRFKDLNCEDLKHVFYPICSCNFGHLS